MAPVDVNSIGVLDTTTHAISYLALTGEAAAGYNKFHGAVTVGDSVYFIPYNQNSVLKLDTGSSVFSQIPLVRCGRRPQQLG